MSLAYTNTHKRSFGYDDNVCQIHLKAGEALSLERLEKTLQQPCRVLRLVIQTTNGVDDSDIAALKEGLSRFVKRQNGVPKQRFCALESIECVWQSKDTLSQENLNFLAQKVRMHFDLPALLGVAVEISVNVRDHKVRLWHAQAMSAKGSWQIWRDRVWRWLVIDSKHFANLAPSFDIKGLLQMKFSWFMLPAALLSVGLWWIGYLSFMWASLLFSIVGMQGHNLWPFAKKIISVLVESPVLMLWGFSLFKLYHFWGLWSTRWVPFPALAIVVGLTLATWLFFLSIPMGLIPSVLSAVVWFPSWPAVVFGLWVWYGTYRFISDACMLSNYTTLLQNKPFIALMGYLILKGFAFLGWPIIAGFNVGFAAFSYVLITCALMVCLYKGLGAWAEHLEEKYHLAVKKASHQEDHVLDGNAMVSARLSWLLAPFGPDYWQNIDSAVSTCAKKHAKCFVLKPTERVVAGITDKEAQALAEGANLTP